MSEQTQVEFDATLDNAVIAEQAREIFLLRRKLEQAKQLLSEISEAQKALQTQLNKQHSETDTNQAEEAPDKE